MARPSNGANNETVNGVFNLNSLLEDLPTNSASAPNTPFPDAMTKAPIGRSLHAHHNSLSAASAYSAYHAPALPGATASPVFTGSPALGGSGGRNAPDPYGQQGQERGSAYRMPRTINVSVFNGQLRRGHCKFFNSQKGFGFINDSKPEDLDHVEVFVHFTAIASTGGFRSLGENEECEYTLVPGPKGYQASNVTGPGGRPVMGDPKARAPVAAKHPPPYMFMPPHGPAFYDPYHAHHAQAAYYPHPHSPYQQVMLSIVPTNAGSPYAVAGHPGHHPHYPGAHGSPYAMHGAAPGASLPPSPPATANGQHPAYMYANGMPAGQQYPGPGSGTPASRSSPFTSASPYGLGLGALGNGGVGKTPWMPPASVAGLGGHRVSAAEASGRYGSPSLGHSTAAEASPVITPTPLNGAGDSLFANGAKHVKQGSISAAGSTAGYDGGAPPTRRGSSAQELFDGAVIGKPSSTTSSTAKAPTHQHKLSSAGERLLYSANNAASSS